MIILSIESKIFWRYHFNLDFSNIIIPITITPKDQFNLLKNSFINGKDKIVAKVDENFFISDKAIIKVYTFSNEELNGLYSTLNLFKQEFQCLNDSTV